MKRRWKNNSLKALARGAVMKHGVKETSLIQNILGGIVDPRLSESSNENVSHDSRIQERGVKLGLNHLSFSCEQPRIYFLATRNVERVLKLSFRRSYKYDEMTRIVCVSLCVVKKRI